MCAFFPEHWGLSIFSYTSFLLRRIVREPTIDIQSAAAAATTIARKRRLFIWKLFYSFIWHLSRTAGWVGLGRMTRQALCPQLENEKVIKEWSANNNSYWFQFVLSLSLFWLASPRGGACGHSFFLRQGRIPGYATEGCREGTGCVHDENLTEHCF